MLKISEQDLKANELRILACICVFDLVLLFICAKFLSISYYEAQIFFYKDDLIGYLVRFSTSIIGQNDFALRFPIVLLHMLSVVLLHAVSKFYLQNSLDRLICVVIFILLPGSVVNALVVNNAAICVALVLALVYLFHVNFKKSFYILLFMSFFVNGDFLVVYVAFFIFAISKKDANLAWVSAILFLVSMYFYGFNTGGRPSGHFADTFGIFAAVFSPFVFFYFVYTIYRIWVKENKTLLWYICVSVFCFCMILSLRQRLELENFLPFCIVATPLMVKMFFSTYRVRLSRFRKKYNIMAGFILFTLILNYLAIVFNPLLYSFLSEPSSHFAYKFHIAKELAKELRKLGINELKSNERLGLRLEFYGIKNSGKSLKKVKNGDINIKILGKNIASFDLK